MRIVSTSVGVICVSMLVLAGCTALSSQTDSGEGVVTPAAAIVTATTNINSSIDNGNPTNTSDATPSRPVRIDGDAIVVPTLDELVKLSPIIFIGAVEETTGIVNTARNVDDITKPDDHIFHLGQLYDVKVEKYLKGEGTMTQSVVQVEGQLYQEDQLLPPAITQEIVDEAREGADYIPMAPGTRYLFFVKLIGIGSDKPYAAPSYGFPWRFLLAEDGRAKPESPIEEANSLYPVRSSEALLAQVGQMVEAQR